MTRTRCSLILIALAMVGSLRSAMAAELIADPSFHNGFILWDPKPGKHVRYGEIAGPKAELKPIWGLSQWSSKFPLQPGEAHASGGFLTASNAAKSVTLALSGADLSLRVNSLAEYGPVARRREDPWVHLLVEQEFANPAFLANLDKAVFHLEARLLSSINLHQGDYSPDCHAAQFQVFFTVQNRNAKSPGHGDMLWFGIPVYDNRFTHPPAFKSKDFGGTEKFIFTPDGKTFTSETAHEGRWIAIEKDLLPLIREALDLAWSKGFLAGSRDLADYAIGGMNMGWELPGTFDVELEVRNLSLQVIGK